MADHLEHRTGDSLFGHRDNANRHKGFFIGQGYDVHPLVKDRKLILGGVEIVILLTVGALWSDI